MTKLPIIAGLAILSFVSVTNSLAEVDPYFSNLPPTLSESASIDCTRAGSAVAKILCGSREGAKADWDLNSTLWATAGTITEAQQKALDQDQGRWRGWLNNKCLQPPPFAGDIPQDQQRCVISEFHGRATQLRSKLTGDALAEARLSPEQHAQIQDLLITQGLLQPPADGEFGSITRQAIKRFQAIDGVPQTGFLSREQIARLRTAERQPQSSLLASAKAPSFNCAKATHPDEFVICSNTELSQLDNIANAGYEYVRRVYGAQYANATTLPLLHARRACGSEVTCIRAEQLAAIQKFQSVGAPVSGPKLAEEPPQASLGSNAQSPVGSQTKAVVTQQPTSVEQTTAIQKFQSVPAPAQSSAPTLPGQHSTSAEGNSDGGKLIAFLVLLIVVGCGWLLYRAQRRAIVLLAYVRR